MKFFLSQMNAHVGDIAGNFKKIKAMIKANRDVDMIVFPELAITGYLPLDLIFNDAFVDENIRQVERLAREVEDQYIILGFIDKSGVLNPQGLPKRRNAAALIHNGAVIHIFHKTLLPTYDVFDEYRYFETAEDVAPYGIEIANQKISLGVEICEDLWDDAYRSKVTEHLVKKGAHLVVNISASPFERKKMEDRRAILSQRSAQHHVPMIYCNLLGGQDELIFDGQCLVTNSAGEIVANSLPFSDEGLFVELDANLNVTPNIQHVRDEMEQLRGALVLGVRDYIRKSGFEKVVLGLSGGVDSALVAAMAADALGAENVLALLMPSQFSSEHSVIDAEKVAGNLGISYHQISIKEIYEVFDGKFREFFRGMEFDVAEENLQARIRGDIIMAFSNKFGGLALATGNKTEFALGYSTLYGDMCGSLAPIGDLQKTVVYELCRFYNKSAGYDLIPQGIIDKIPSAELHPDQVDPFDYDIMSPLVDEIIENYASVVQLVEKGYDEELVKKTYRSIMQSEYKRWQAPPVLKISKCAFGIGRKMPLVNKFIGI